MSESSAGPSSSTLVSPPECLVHDHLSAQELIAVRRSPKRSFVRLFRSKTAQDRRRHSTDSDDNQSNNSGPSVSEDSDTLEIPFIKLGDGLVYSAEYEEDHARDVYRWAVLYENQRGYVSLCVFMHQLHESIAVLRCSPRHIIPPCRYCQTTRGPSRPRLLQSQRVIVSQPCLFLPILFQMVPGVGCRGHGWLTCAAMARHNTTGLNTIGTFVAKIGVPA